MITCAAGALHHWQRIATTAGSQFEDYLAGLTRHYGMEQRWPDAPFWARRIKGASAEKGA